MKVLNVTEFYSERGGGVRSHLTHKGHVSCQLGHELIVVAPGPRDSEESYAVEVRSDKQSYRVIRIAGPSLPYDPTYHLLWRVDKVRALVERERPDVLEIDSPYLAAASALSVPRAHFGVRTFVWHADFIDTYIGEPLRAHVAQPAVRAIVEPLWAWARAISSRCDATFVAGHWIEDKLRAHGMQRVVWVPFGIERSLFRPGAPDADARVRQELLGPEHAGAALLVGVGRFAVEKRWDVVLDAFCKVRQERDAVLVLYGDGPERDAMQARVRGRDDVRFMGFERDRSKLAAALASADALVHGCPHETFGFAIAEAMSVGLPVVVPDAGGAGELADSRSAERYAAGDAAAAAIAVARMLARVHADRCGMRNNAQRAADKLCTVEEQFARTYAVYGELLDATRRRG